MYQIEISMPEAGRQAAAAFRELAVQIQIWEDRRCQDLLERAASQRLAEKVDREFTGG